MNKVILIVEDDPGNMRVFRDLLQIKGYDTLEATDGRQGVDLAKENIPDLILMDIQLPVLNGLEATKILKADPSTAKIPIIGLTACAMPEDRERTLDAGCDDYLAKPTDISTFLQKVAQHARNGDA